MERLISFLMLKAVAAFFVLLMGMAALAQNPETRVVREAATHPPGIASISVCDPNGAGGPGSCPKGSLDTHQIVLGPDGNSINMSGVALTSDEHSSIFSPGTLGGNNDYLFFVASGSSLAGRDIGTMVLSGGSGPGKNGQWTFDFPKADGYGSYPAGFGQVFGPPTSDGLCPVVADGNPAHQDQTFDLTYAAPGSVVKDPTGGPASLLMIYEAVNSCVGSVGGVRPGNGDSYLSAGVATSLDAGKTWPTYRSTPTFSFVPLPMTNATQGPNAPTGALGAAVCVGNDCTTAPPASYGRYPVITPSVSLASLIAAGRPLQAFVGDGEISGFVDDAGTSPAQHLYIVYGPLKIARAQFNGGTAPLSFLKWNRQAFASPGIGGPDGPLFPTGPFQNCEAQDQDRFGGSISYVQDTQQYLLTFVCTSQGDPAGGQIADAQRGGAWFYSTSYDLSDQTQWSTPQEITGSWSVFDNSNGCPDYKGWYPTLMSPNSQPGHLSTGGYVFYLWGCQTDTHGRQFSSRAFTITVPDFSLAFDQSTVTTSAPSKATVTLNIDRTGGFAGNVTLTPTSALPSGIKLPGFPVSTTGASLSFKIKLKGNAKSGSYPIVFAGKDESGRERDATLTLVVQ